MNIIELVDKLTGEYGLDMSGDSPDAWRQVYVDDSDDNRLVTNVSINHDGDIVLEIA